MSQDFMKEREGQHSSTNRIQLLVLGSQVAQQKLSYSDIFQSESNDL
jgi:hypothetical protein